MVILVIFFRHAQTWKSPLAFLEFNSIVKTEAMLMKFAYAIRLKSH